MENHPIGDLMETTMAKIREMIDVNTIIGQPITTPDGITLIPVSKVSFGFASGGSDFAVKQATQPNAFGGGSGAGVNIVPVAFIVIKDGYAKVLNIVQEAPSSVEKLIDATPEIIDKLSGLRKKDDDKTVEG